MSDFPKLDVSIPEFAGHHPFSKGEKPKFYRPEDLKDFAPGNTLRTNFFEKHLVALAWKLDGPVPYAFLTADNQVRSLDAGCLGFLAHRNPPQIEFIVGPDGMVTGVLPTKARSDLYEPMRARLLRDIQGGGTGGELEPPAPIVHSSQALAPETSFTPAVIEKALINHGFTKTSTEKVNRFDHERAPFPFYVKIPEEGHATIRRCLVAHPELPKNHPGILDIPGVKVDGPFYHHSHLRAFPARMHTGQNEQKYGLAMDFETLTAFENFISVVLEASPAAAVLEPSRAGVAGYVLPPDILKLLSQANFWWVDQNQTLKEEISGGYLWSPKANKNGVFNQFYENMKLAAPGDLVFSYADQKIGHVGHVLGRAVAASKPAEFGSLGGGWSDDGWLVRVNWSKLENPIKPKEIITELLPTLPPKYSPLQKNGDGLQSVYLATIPEGMARVLLSKSKEIVEHLSEELDAQAEEIPDKFADQVEQALQNDTTIDSTERDSIIKARRGQGKFRRNVASIEKGCRITKVGEAILLRASHIKPWSLCQTNHERLDGNNGLLLTPTFDVLFDRGLLTFSDDGSVVISARISSDVRALIGLELHLLTKPPFNDNQKTYLAFHRENIFRP